MKRFKIIAFSITLITFSVSCEAQNTKKRPLTPQSGQSTSQNIAQNVSVTEFQQKLAAKKNAILLDVRTREEYANGHLQNGTLMDITDANFAADLGKLDKSKPVFVYCAAGGRSSKAMKTMQAMGFKEVYNMVGGFSAWQASGLPSVK